MRHIKTIVFSALLLGAAPATGQILDSSKSTTDLSGTWKLDRSASTDTRTLSRFDEVSLAISQNGSALQVVHTGKRKKKVRVPLLEYFTDGRGEENPNPLGDLQRRSKTFWSYGNLISEYIVNSTVSSTHELYKQEATDIWELSKDCGTLPVRTEVKAAHLLPEILRLFIKPEKYKKVFRRVDVKVTVNIRVYRTENNQVVDSYSNYNNVAYGHGNSVGQARRNALRAAGQMIPAAFIEKVVDNAK